MEAKSKLKELPNPVEGAVSRVNYKTSQNFFEPPRVIGNSVKATNLKKKPSLPYALKANDDFPLEHTPCVKNRLLDRITQNQSTKTINPDRKLS
mmetsp:Transcript_27461/g.41755  ORF Transcript_27461/g.41755 Transcript_27461/m.41755 type:complete len:94 (+) Transcript_27461:1777-2058(+)